MKKHIVILGGGFGGLSAFLYFKKNGGKNFSVTLIDRNDYHLYYPNIYEASSIYFKDDKKINYNKAIKTINIPYNTILKSSDNFKILKTDVENISFAKKEISTKSGVVKYDYLIWALGSEAKYFNIPGAKNYSLGFKSVYDALNIRNKIEEILYEKRDRGIKIIIAGGGFSGCELGAELLFFLKKINQKLNLKNPKTKITIVEATPTILPGAREITKMKALKRLSSIGVEVILNSPIKEVEENSIIIYQVNSFKKLNFDILIWSTGITPKLLTSDINTINIKSGCPVVNAYLQLEPFKEVLAIGDCIYCYDQNGGKIPATAYYAVDQGKIAAYNIISLINEKPLLIYKPQKPIFTIPLGSKYAIVDLNFLIINGFIGWLIKQLINLKYFLSILPVFKAIKLWLLSLWMFIKND